MTDIVFLSAVSSEFHKKDAQNPRSFESYRDVLMLSLRHLLKGCQVIVQEELRQGLGDLLATLDVEIDRSSVVIHLVGDMTGDAPTPAEIRRLRERHPNLLQHEPELAATLVELDRVSYTQWEAYLAFEHRRGRLVFVADATAPRSPLFSPTDAQRALQKAHLNRLASTGEHWEPCFNQTDLARRAVRAIERHGLLRHASQTRPAPEKIAAVRAEASSLASEIGASLRAAARTAVTEYDPAAIATFLQSIDTASLKREIDRRAALEILEEHRARVVAAVAEEPTPENLYELAFAEMALGNYLDAIASIRPYVDRALDQMGTDADRREQHREHALSGYLLWHELCHLAGQREEATRALEAGGALIDAKKEPVLWADFHEGLAEHYLDHAQWDRAEALIDPIIDIREEQGEGSPDLPRSLLVWSRLLYHLANYSGAVSVAARAEALYRQQTPPNLGGIGVAISVQANGHGKLGHFGAAEPLMREALVIAEQNFDTEHVNVARQLNNLAVLLRETRRLDEAEPLMRRALTIVEQSLGADHASVARHFNNLAQLLMATNRVGEAEPLMRRALAIDEQSFGPEHPNVASDLSNLAQLLDDTNRLDEAEPLMRRALSIVEQSFGLEHPEVAIALHNLAALLDSTGRLDEAEPLMRRALAIDEQRFGPAHPSLAIRLNNLAHLLEATNRLGEAEPLMRRALAIAEQSYGPEHTNVAKCLSSLAQLLVATNRLSEAEVLMRRALAIVDQSFGPEHPDVASDLNNLAKLLQATNRLGEAEPLLRRALAIAEQSFGLEHPNVAMRLNNLAVLLQATNRRGEVEPLMRRALAIAERSFGPEHANVAIGLNNLAKLLEATHRLGEAAPLMRRALAILAASLGVAHPSTQTFQENYSQILAAMGRSEAEIDAAVRQALDGMPTPK